MAEAKAGTNPAPKTPMKVLVCIAYYGTQNEPYVRRLIDEYQAMSYDVDLVVVTEAPKELPQAELRVGLPSANPWSLPFAHKSVFAERVDDYDLFIYSEDDTLIREGNIEAFLWATSVLPSDRLAGFLRTEETPDGRLRCSSQHSFYHWMPGSAFRAADQSVFGRFSNDHSAGYMLTRNQLRRCLESGNYLTAPRQGEYDMLVTAATDPYTVCGFERVISLDRLDSFVLPHLTNKYSDSLGVPFDDVADQVAELASSVDKKDRLDGLLSPSPQNLDPAWRKHYHEAPEQAILSWIPNRSAQILSVGAGSGRLEAELVEREHSVTAIPLDHIVAASCRRRGVETLPPNIDQALDLIDGRSFDYVVLSDIVTRLPQPAKTLGQIVAKTGSPTLLVVSPNMIGAKVRRWLRKGPSLPNTSDGLAPSTPRDIKRLLSRAGVRDVKHRPIGRRICGLPRSDWLTGRKMLTAGRIEQT